ncbi:MAG: electron transfer flavoprotein subunit alpha [Lentisphaerae bacterium]|nr:electron transfer flavoprotein subunit alpha [Lentisphaerota bacterium]
MKIVAFKIEGNGTFAKDVPAIAEAVKSSGADLVILPGNSRVKRSAPAAAFYAGAEIDTNVIDVEAQDGRVVARRWVYRQRILTEFTRTAKPWVLVTDPSLFEEICAKVSAESAAFTENVAASTRTVMDGVVNAGMGVETTIKPDANLLFVAGAGWTKKQADGALHFEEAASSITGFIGKANASLGSSKSLVDMPEAATAFTFMSHMNQVGQTGSTPRHQKGLATCCHGEEPHVVGWRFISERRAINLDANCGWVQGKADIVYVADAFAVMKKVNELLG